MRHFVSRLGGRGVRMSRWGYISLVDIKFGWHGYWLVLTWRSKIIDVSDKLSDDGCMRSNLSKMSKGPNIRPTDRGCNL